MALAIHQYNVGFVGRSGSAAIGALMAKADVGYRLGRCWLAIHRRRSRDAKSDSIIRDLARRPNILSLLHNRPAESMSSGYML